MHCNCKQMHTTQLGVTWWRQHWVQRRSSFKPLVCRCSLLLPCLCFSLLLFLSCWWQSYSQSLTIFVKCSESADKKKIYTLLTTTNKNSHLPHITVLHVSVARNNLYKTVMNQILWGQTVTAIAIILSRQQDFRDLRLPVSKSQQQVHRQSSQSISFF